MEKVLLPIPHHYGRVEVSNIKGRYLITRDSSMMFMSVEPRLIELKPCGELTKEMTKRLLTPCEWDVTYLEGVLYAKVGNWFESFHCSLTEVWPISD